MKTCMTLSTLTILATLGDVSTLFAEGSLRWLDGFTGGGGPWRAALVSADGKVVVANGPTGVLRWKADEGYIDLGSLPGFPYTIPMSLSADGSLIVGRSIGDSGYPFRWTMDEGMQALPPLADGPDMVGAYGVSADGSIVLGVTGRDHAGQAMLWSKEGGQTLGSLSSALPYSWAGWVSADATAVVGTTEVDVDGVSGYGAFRWTAEEGMVALGTLVGGYYESHANAISADGSVIVGRSWTDGGTNFFGGRSAGEAFRWTKETGMVGLGDLPGGGFRSEALAVSGDGSVVVGWSEVDEVRLEPWGDYMLVPGAFVWTQPQGMRSVKEIAEIDLGLDVTGCDFGFATGVSADGTVIVGTGTGTNGTGVWLLTIPEPPASALIIVGLCCLATYRLCRPGHRVAPLLAKRSAPRAGTDG